ncbi:MAG: tripartite tricarboxylate transporter TctB family protein [Desulfarculus sp.]|nr:tripartite tricarboxylate transporter TctB family protein [Pseudomonadota bacterium]MBV1718327.1 tripartite tricarboxylate transporter TctB family protein [Desulfarculus sp.]MBU4573512.1 tripartite tricarboxylate transporter TctB family protein [Pseudomonadota bacterium]MBU4599518.1 tripartite tricarboxylate transporter TctB family protein [Pseudomonadota bacterium]MBV1739662.1 tripartite tricarboxylate transporter TctB family protein [Desulfarculus sp.]
MVKFNRDTMAGSILLAFSLILAFIITPDQVEMHRSVALLALSPRLFCYITAGLLGLTSAVLIIASLKKGHEADAHPTSWEPLLRGLFCTAIACAYAALAGIIGFFVSTALAMTAFLLYFGVRRWVGIVLFLVVVLGFIYVLFIQALKVVMPDGLLY